MPRTGFEPVSSDVFDEVGNFRKSPIFVTKIRNDWPGYTTGALSHSHFIFVLWPEIKWARWDLNPRPPLILIISSDMKRAHIRAALHRAKLRAH
jgi:hypothetical protein